MSGAPPCHLQLYLNVNLKKGCADRASTPFLVGEEKTNQKRPRLQQKCDPILKERRRRSWSSSRTA